ncbi:MAG: type II toxin-antitoxin system Phd/YefM family antitoxin [Thermoguttaceae bacterium]
MNIYTYSEARQQLGSVLDRAEVDGKVLVRRRDGAMFSIMPVAEDSSSPFDVPSVETGISMDDWMEVLHQERARSTHHQ